MKAILLYSFVVHFAAHVLDLFFKFKLITQLDAAINYRLLNVASIPLNMFRASLCPSSGAYQLQQQQHLVYRRNVVVAVLLAVFSPVVFLKVGDQQMTSPGTKF
jgi:hypothetical protein